MNKKFICIISFITAMAMIVTSCALPANNLMKWYGSKVDASSLEPLEPMDENMSLISSISIF